MYYDASGGGVDDDDCAASDDQNIRLTEYLPSAYATHASIINLHIETACTAKMMEYLHLKKPKHQDHPEKVEEPVLTEEDEAFLRRIANEGTPPSLPERPQDLLVAGDTRGNEAQIALLDGAQNIPLPDTPAEESNRSIGDEGDVKGKGKSAAKQSKPIFKWSFHRRDSRNSKRKDKETAATDLMSAAEGLKEQDHSNPNEDGLASDPEAKKEEEELTAVLDKLNLAAVNNRAFSISDESRDLLRKYVKKILAPIISPARANIYLQPQVHPCTQRPSQRRTNSIRRPRIPPHKFRTPAPTLLQTPSSVPPKTHRVTPVQDDRIHRSRAAGRRSREARAAISQIR